MVSAAKMKNAVWCSESTQVLRNNPLGGTFLGL